MAIILCIESATKVCSVALFNNDQLLAIKEQGGNYSHAENLAVFVDELLEEQGIERTSLDAVAVSEGPGSYTGLRIGVALAKGICYALQIPLIAIPSLEAMTYGAIQSRNNADCYYIPMIDARRMEVYAAVYSRELNEVQKVAAIVLDEKSFGSFTHDKPVFCFGDGAAKFNEINQLPEVHFAPNLLPSSKFIGPLAYKKWKEMAFENLAYFNPFYLKEFQTTVSKK